MSGQLRVLLIVPDGERLGGAENLLLTLLRNLDGSGIDPTACFLADGPFPRELRELGVRTLTTDAGRLRHAHRFAATVRRLAYLMRSESPDVILSWMQKSHLYAAPAAVLAGMTDRLVWWQHDIPRREWRNVLPTLLPARAIATCSRAAASAQRGLWPTRPVFTVRAGIEPPAKPHARDVAGLREDLGIPPERFVIGIAARLQPWKGQHHVLRATALLRDRGHDLHCLIVGGDAYGHAPGYPGELRRLAGDLGIAQAVTFTGHVPDTPRYLELMDVSVNASDAEPFGLAVLESLALGVPVVAVAAGGPAEILAGERAGLLVERADPGLFADAIARLIDDRGLLSRLGGEGRALFESCYRPEAMAVDLRSELATLTASSDGSGG